MVVDHEVAAVGADGQGWALLGPHEHIQGITDVWLNIVFLVLSDLYLYTIRGRDTEFHWLMLTAETLVFDRLSN